jgi:hypothetical protein
MALKFNNAMYYEASYLKEKCPGYFKGCVTNVSKVITKKKIPKELYTYASFSVKTGWTMLGNDHDNSNGVLKNRKKLLLDKKWCDENIMGIGINNRTDNEIIDMEIDNLSDKQVKNIKNVILDTSIAPISCIYLYTLGKVKELRDIFEIPTTFQDNHNVVKYGLTKDLNRRTLEHQNTYGTLISQVSTLSLKYHVVVDEMHLYSAEKDVKDFLNGDELILKHKKFKELACLSDDVLNIHIKYKYAHIGSVYSTSLRQIQKELEKANEIREKEKEIIELNKMLIESKEREIQLYKLLLEQKEVL